VRVEEAEYAEGEFAGLPFGGDLIAGVNFEAVLLFAIVSISAGDSENGKALAIGFGTDEDAAALVGITILGVLDHNGPRCGGKLNHAGLIMPEGFAQVFGGAVAQDSDDHSSFAFFGHGRCDFCCGVDIGAGGDADQQTFFAG